MLKHPSKSNQVVLPCTRREIRRTGLVLQDLRHIHSISSIRLTQTGSKPFRCKTFEEPLIHCNPNDIYKSMILKQPACRYINVSAGINSLRKSVIQKLYEASVKYKISSLIIAVSVAFVDSLIDSNSLNYVSVEGRCVDASYIGVVCLMIASKFHESNYSPLSLSRSLFDVLSHSSDPQCVKRMERKVSEMLDWTFDLITPAHFLRFYMSKGSIR